MPVPETAPEHRAAYRAQGSIQRSARRIQMCFQEREQVVRVARTAPAAWKPPTVSGGTGVVPSLRCPVASVSGPPGASVAPLSRSGSST